MSYPAAGPGEVSGGGQAGLAAERGDERARRLVADPARDPADGLARREQRQRRLQPQQGPPPPERHPGLRDERPRERPLAGPDRAPPVRQRALVSGVLAQRLARLGP